MKLTPITSDGKFSIGYNEHREPCEWTGNMTTKVDDVFVIIYRAPTVGIPFTDSNESYCVIKNGDSLAWCCINTGEIIEEP